MRATVLALAIMSTVTPAWADGLADSLRIDLSLYRARMCLGENTPQAPLPFVHAPRVTPCISDRFAAIKDPNTWEMRPTAWYSLSGSTQLGIGLDFAAGNKDTTLKLRGRRVMFEWRF